MNPYHASTILYRYFTPLITILAIGHYELSLTKEFNPDTEQSKLPNIFLIDLYKQQISDFQSMVSQEHNLAMMVRTRFSKINNEHVSEYAKKLSNDYFLVREQNLTSRANLYDSEYLIKGTWFDPDNNIIEASIEERFARRLKLSLGDELEFIFVGIPLK